MKKLNILLLSAIALGMTLTSCSKDDDREPSLEGKWTFSTIQTFNPAGEPDSEAEAIDGLDGPSDASCTTPHIDFLTFNKISATPKNAVYGNYPSEGCDLENFDITYAKSGDQVTLTGLFTQPLPFTASITSTQLKLKYVDDQGAIVFTLIKS